LETRNYDDGITESLRLLTPLLKLYCASQSISVGSEGIRAFGAQGYIEETGIPNLLLEAQVILFKFIQKDLD
jgi:alkylation response protein AidB-like acyl-CoA dehydrogenase